MIDLHTHSIFSDGALIPSELVRRAKVKGYRAIAITDHGDHSNADFIIPRVAQVCRKLSAAYAIQVIPGIELTHVPPEYICELAVDCRSLGARIIVVHGETIVEPVIAGTNAAALQSPIDILAHPGLITEEEAFLAAKNNICLEVSARKGHSLTNGHVVIMARQAIARLVLNTDSHAPHDMISRDSAFKIAAGAGMLNKEIEIMFQNSELLVERALQAR
ncbi:MAG: histidinol phosphate phosphatase domain-containing protein [Deltaproteobacteria bacterium]|nr:histidinol phosphate phosphatase domain-containing protein [Deltaproteobacteria bacterium]